jgi:hypothetical protein
MDLAKGIAVEYSVSLLMAYCYTREILVEVAALSISISTLWGKVRMARTGLTYEKVRVPLDWAWHRGFLLDIKE